MAPSYILIFAIIALLGGLVAGGRWRGWFILAGSVLAVYGLQPEVPIRSLDFWLPTASLGLVILGWGLTRPAGEKIARADLLAGLGMLALAGLVGLLRYAGPLCCLTPTRPPVFPQVLIGLGVLALLGWLAAIFTRTRPLTERIKRLIVVPDYSSTHIAKVMRHDAAALAAENGDLVTHDIESRIHTDHHHHHHDPPAPPGTPAVEVPVASPELETRDAK